MGSKKRREGGERKKIEKVKEPLLLGSTEKGSSRTLGIFHASKVISLGFSSSIILFYVSDYHL